MKLWSALIFSFVLQALTLAQIPVGNWRLHLPSRNVIHVAYSPGKVFCTTGESIFSYNLKDNNVEKLSKISGLSDFGSSSIAYSPDRNILVIGYENGNIDILKGKSVYNISDLKRKSIPANKAIKHIFIDGNNAYLSCGFGILLLDLDKKEIKDTYIFGPGGTFIDVNSCIIQNNILYAATTIGIYKADKNDPYLIDFSRWSKVLDVPNANDAFTQVTSDNNILFAIYSNPVAGDKIYYYKDNGWNTLNLEDNSDIFHIGFSDQHIIISTSINIRFYSKDLKLDQTIWQYLDVSANPRETFKDNLGNLWIADFGNGLIVQQKDGTYKQIMPNGPISSRLKSFYFSDNHLYAAAGGTGSSYDNLYNRAEFSVFYENEWKSYQNPDAFDFMVVRSDPVDKSLIYVGSWGAGIYTYRNGEIVNHFDETTSTLQSAIQGSPYIRVGSMSFDSKGNLWAANTNVNNTLSVLKRDGQWTGYPLRNAIGADFLGDLVIDDYDNVWLVLLKGNGIMVLNTNGTPENPDDDQLVKFKPKNAFKQTVNVYSLAKDLDGNIWVGTDFGIVKYTDPNEVFEGNTDGEQPTLRRYGTDQNDPLLGSEIVRTIAVDGANRKWIGTERGGAFLVSSDGDSTIHQFNTENSPIFSNSIVGIGIQDKTGEVFFGTDRGIISYRSDATLAGEDFGDVYAFPNPVRHDYHGNITITGLIKDASVKITDIAGNIVYETSTLGGQVVWDGKNFSGRRVATGIYIIFCTNDDGTKTFITKLLFLK